MSVRVGESRQARNGHRRWAWAGWLSGVLMDLAGWLDRTVNVLEGWSFRLGYLAAEHRERASRRGGQAS